MPQVLLFDSMARTGFLSSVPGTQHGLASPPCPGADPINRSTAKAGVGLMVNPGASVPMCAGAGHAHPGIVASRL